MDTCGPHACDSYMHELLMQNLKNEKKQKTQMVIKWKIKHIFLCQNISNIAWILCAVCSLSQQ